MYTSTGKRLNVVSCGCQLCFNTERPAAYMDMGSVSKYPRVDDVKFICEVCYTLALLGGEEKERYQSCQ